MASHMQFPIYCSQYSDTKFYNNCSHHKKENSKFIARFSNIQLGFQVILKQSNLFKASESAHEHVTCGGKSRQAMLS